MTDATEPHDPRFTKDTLRCPCGVTIHASSEDELVALAQEHLRESHPGREYSREEILFIAS